MTITRWTPMNDWAVLQNRLNSIFSDFRHPDDKESMTAGSGITAGSFVPPVDIYEDEAKLVMKLEAPGIPQENFDVRVENNLLTISGERKFENETKQEDYHRIERRYGSFVRSFSLPTTVDTANIQAHYDAGVLTVEMAKRAEAKPKQIKVSVGAAAAKPAQVEHKPAA